jgi:CRISPR-associated protein Cas2
VLVVVAYDVRTEDKAGRRRLRRVAKLCQNFGQRVQFSVFECLVDPAQWANLKAKLLAEIDPKADSLRFYFLGANWQNRIEHIGAKQAYDPEGPLVV